MKHKSKKSAKKAVLPPSKNDQFDFNGHVEPAIKRETKPKSNAKTASSNVRASAASRRKSKTPIVTVEEVELPELSEPPVEDVVVASSQPTQTQRKKHLLWRPEWGVPPSTVLKQPAPPPKLPIQPDVPSQLVQSSQPELDRTQPVAFASALQLRRSTRLSSDKQQPQNFLSLPDSSFHKRRVKQRTQAAAAASSSSSSKVHEFEVPASQNLLSQRCPVPDYSSDSDATISDEEQLHKVEKANYRFSPPKPLKQEYQAFAPFEVGPSPQKPEPIALISNGSQSSQRSTNNKRKLEELQQPLTSELLDETKEEQMEESDVEQVNEFVEPSDDDVVFVAQKLPVAVEAIVSVIHQRQSIPVSTIKNEFVESSQIQTIDLISSDDDRSNDVEEIVPSTPVESVKSSSPPSPMAADDIIDDLDKRQMVIEPTPIARQPTPPAASDSTKQRNIVQFLMDDRMQEPSAEFASQSPPPQASVDAESALTPTLPSEVYLDHNQAASCPPTKLKLRSHPTMSFQMGNLPTPLPLPAPFPRTPITSNFPAQPSFSPATFVSPAPPKKPFTSAAALPQKTPQTPAPAPSSSSSFSFASPAPVAPDSIPKSVGFSFASKKPVVVNNKAANLFDDIDQEFELEKQKFGSNSDSNSAGQNGTRSGFSSAKKQAAPAANGFSSASSAPSASSAAFSAPGSFTTGFSAGSGKKISVSTKKNNLFDEDDALVEQELRNLQTAEDADADAMPAPAPQAPSAGSKPASSKFALASGKQAAIPSRDPDKMNDFFSDDEDDEEAKQAKKERLKDRPSFGAASSIAAASSSSSLAAAAIAALASPSPISSVSSYALPSVPSSISSSVTSSSSSSFGFKTPQPSKPPRSSITTPSPAPILRTKQTAFKTPFSKNRIPPASLKTPTTPPNGTASGALPLPLPLSASVSKSSIARLRVPEWLFVKDVIIKRKMKAEALANKTRISLRELKTISSPTSISFALDIEPEVQSMSSTSAATYSFPLSDSDRAPSPEFLYEFKSILSKPLFSGGLTSTAFHSILLSMGALPSFCTEEWVDNHYKWIVWKLASYERQFSDKFAMTGLTADRVLSQLVFRYRLEHEEGQRSCLKKIIERDVPPHFQMVLVISDLSPTVLNPTQESMTNPNLIEWMELSDGWYSIKSNLSPLMISLFRKQKLFVGQKLRISGAKLSGPSEGAACPPLEAPSSLRLFTSLNSIRHAEWDTKLGFRPDQLFVTVPSLNIDGGPAATLQLYIMRKYPVLTMERIEEAIILDKKRQNQRHQQQQQQPAEEDPEPVVKRIFRTERAGHKVVNQMMAERTKLFLEFLKEFEIEFADARKFEMQPWKQHGLIKSPQELLELGGKEIVLYIDAMGGLEDAKLPDELVDVLTAKYIETRQQMDEEDQRRVVQAAEKEMDKMDNDPDGEPVMLAGGRTGKKIVKRSFYTVQTVRCMDIIESEKMREQHLQMSSEELGDWMKRRQCIISIWNSLPTNGYLLNGADDGNRLQQAQEEEAASPFQEGSIIQVSGLSPYNKKKHRSVAMQLSLPRGPSGCPIVLFDATIPSKSSSSSSSSSLQETHSRMMSLGPLFAPRSHQPLATLHHTHASNFGNFGRYIEEFDTAALVLFVDTMESSGSLVLGLADPRPFMATPSSPNAKPLVGLTLVRISSGPNRYFEWDQVKAGQVYAFTNLVRGHALVSPHSAYSNRMQQQRSDQFNPPDNPVTYVVHDCEAVDETRFFGGSDAGAPVYLSQERSQIMHYLRANKKCGTELTSVLKAIMAPASYLSASASSSTMMPLPLSPLDCPNSFPMDVDFETELKKEEEQEDVQHYYFFPPARLCLLLDGASCMLFTLHDQLFVRCGMRDDSISAAQPAAISIPLSLFCEKFVQFLKPFVLEDQWNNLILVYSRQVNEYPNDPSSQLELLANYMRLLIQVPDHNPPPLADIHEQDLKVAAAALEQVLAMQLDAATTTEDQKQLLLSCFGRCFFRCQLSCCPFTSDPSLPCIVSTIEPVNPSDVCQSLEVLVAGSS